MGVVQTLDISPVGRVEGDLDVRVDVQDGVVVNAWTQAELFRGFQVDRHLEFSWKLYWQIIWFSSV